MEKTQVAEETARGGKTDCVVLCCVGSTWMSNGREKARGLKEAVVRMCALWRWVGEWQMDAMMIVLVLEATWVVLWVADHHIRKVRDVTTTRQELVCGKSFIAWLYEIG